MLYFDVLRTISNSASAMSSPAFHALEVLSFRKKTIVIWDVLCYKNLPSARKRFVRVEND